MTLAFVDTNSKLVKVVTVADVDYEDRVGNSLFKLCCRFRFGHKANSSSDFEHKVWLRFEVEVQARF